MKEITIKLYNGNTRDTSTKITLDELGYVYIADEDVFISLEPEEVGKLLELLLNKNQNF